MKTKALKIAIAACLTFSLASCGGNGTRNADQEGDTTLTDSPNNTQVEGTDTMMTDTAATGQAPGGAVGPEGQGATTDTTSRSSMPAH
ncbi:hypothetical protein [Arcticibacter sp. MXS-1]|uniref:hypothetical protein n=1 Tax=Arcticibacter sp. MXS-1 TaxID=3341726 RepID=UPI0035A93435